MQNLLKIKSHDLERDAQCIKFICKSDCWFESLIIIPKTIIMANTSTKKQKHEQDICHYLMV